MNIKPSSKVIFYSIERAIKEYRKFAQKSISAKINDITVDQGLVLSFLNNYPELSQKEIAKMMFRDNASMTRMIDLMVKKGYLERSMNDKDRRRHTIEITDNGKQILEELPPVISSNRKIALKGITNEEIEQLEKTLGKIISNCTQ
ncbi:MarR family transcriptional regulator [Aquimarina sp. 2201CG5-10]|uniref:MarR family winged helix-turn-helix transcriptional regulator n=1 Tax=Aquimarina callyspongiae TaxID=3098150 RepID=UPI002AB447B4|nr:MarR family transcriptional regulator [Aquimarina sp. 2201CG5-10]MDY8135868.1 MarR family transcriptional regulator [Aquimarina sp. 2201CG5-10]